MPIANTRRSIERARKRAEQRAEALNPNSGKVEADRMYLKRLMQRIGEIYAYTLDHTERCEQLWLPYSCITSKDNDRATQTLSEWQKAYRDPDGYLKNTHDYQRKATNRILVSTWYRNADQDLYHVMKPIISPLPCDYWGNTPLTRAQWSAAIDPLIEAYGRWTWVHAVRDYWHGDPSWTYGGTFGWQMETGQKLKRIAKGSDLCIGKAILMPVLIKYSQRHQ